MQILLANPRGFCAGVNRAIEIVEQVLELYGPPIYVRHEVVHNKFVVDGLRQRGAIFIDNLTSVPPGAPLIFSAHGVSIAVRDEARQHGLNIFDATCPLVTKVHLEVARHNRDGYELILIGHAGHPEVEGTLGQLKSSTSNAIHLVETADDVARLEIQHPDKLAYVTQTTLSMDDTSTIITLLRQRYPQITGPKSDDICYATQNRQDAVKQLAKNCDVILVVGSVNSSNSNRLREIGEKLGTRAYLIDGAEEMQQSWFDNATTVGITAGASAPEVLVEEVIQHLKRWGAKTVNALQGVEESTVFPLPKELRTAQASPR
ncbi:MAG: 4-hydroxy-3-methylbut-2-enyl diphosphate reductase [Gammaproteobacteria bacterium]|nr:4-hydroxy-3-methylbut-2-enyl diphosphate reductase [Gammaproteobacteria bacterium]